MKRILNPAKSYAFSKVVGSEIVEMVYDPEAKETGFLAKDKGGVTYLEGYDLDPRVYPYPANHPLIAKKIILLPSRVEDYGDTRELAERVRGFIHRYLQISPTFEKLVAYYVLLTWVYDRFDELPYIRAIGEFGSGKSRLLKVVGSLCYRPMFVGGATTTSPIFRIIDMARGTLILDEADYQRSDTTADITKILNAGYQRDGSVLRSEGKGVFEVKAYEVYGPKIIATRKSFHDPALESRFLVEEMDKKNLRDDIPLNIPADFESQALVLRNQLLMWRFDHYSSTGLRIEEIDRSLEPRLNQITAALLSIVDEPELKQDIKNLVQEYDKQITVQRGMTFEAEIFWTLLGWWSFKDRPTIKEVTDIYQLYSGESRGVNTKRIGNVVRKDLALKAKRGTGGSYVVSKVENKQRVELLKRKFGISDNEVNEENELKKIIKDHSLSGDTITLTERLGSSGGPAVDQEKLLPGF